MFDDIAATNNILTLTGKNDGVIRQFSAASSPHYVRYGVKHELCEITKLIVSLKTMNEPYLTQDWTPTILVLLTKYNHRCLTEAIISEVTSKPARSFATAKQISDALAEKGFKFESKRPIIDSNNELSDFLNPATESNPNRSRRAPINISIVHHGGNCISSDDVVGYLNAMGMSHLKIIGVYIDQVSEVAHCSTLCEQQLGEISMRYNIPIITRANHDTK